jgi:uncharacterized protein (TIGR02217 family)
VSATFKEEQFPTNVAYGYASGDAFETEYVATGGGKSYKSARWALPKRKFTIDTPRLTPTQAMAVRAFKKSVAFGRLYNFRLKDWNDFTSDATGITPASITATDVVIGTGDGINKIFQLVKKYPSGASTLTYTIVKPVAGTVRIADAGSEVFSPATWSVDTTTGIITFVSAPTTGHSITAGFQYDTPVEFDDDYLPAAIVDYNQFEFKAIGLTEVRDL